MRTVGELGEFRLIDRIAGLVPGVANVIEGIGDDCAVLRFGERVVLASCDMSVENVHFRRAHASAADIGWKIAAASLSDIAAMGGVPRFGLVALSCAPDTPIEFVEELYRGMTAVATKYEAAIVGGDVTRSDGGMSIDVTVLGELKGDRYLSRKGARPGDLLAVTGELGLSGAGLHALEHGHDATELAPRHYHPEPRIREGQWLCAQPGVHAMIDISDGLLQDAWHLGEAGGLGLNLFPDRMHPALVLAKYCERHGLNPLDFMLRGGEDYELAFAVEADDTEDAFRRFHEQFSTKLSVVGEFTGDWMGLRFGGKPVSAAGFNHFA